MALASKKTPRVVDLSNSSKKAKLQAKFDDTVYLDTVVDNPDDHPELAAILLQIQNINDDMDLIRTYAGDVKGDIPTTTISDVQAATVNNLHLDGGALIPTTTEGHTVSLSVTNSRGAYALIFTMVDGSGETPVTKTTKVNLG